VQEGRAASSDRDHATPACFGHPKQAVRHRRVSFREEKLHELQWKHRDRGGDVAATKDPYLLLLEIKPTVSFDDGSGEVAGEPVTRVEEKDNQVAPGELFAGPAEHDGDEVAVRAREVQAGGHVVLPSHAHFYEIAGRWMNLEAQKRSSNRRYMWMTLSSHFEHDCQPCPASTSEALQHGDRPRLIRLMACAASHSAAWISSSVESRKRLHPTGTCASSGMQGNEPVRPFIGAWSARTVSYATPARQHASKRPLKWWHVVGGSIGSARFLMRSNIAVADAHST
jgi:hypothetical protein